MEWDWETRDAAKAIAGQHEKEQDRREGTEAKR